jgi:pimeloyl-ACP methyl ester carboxylesterase
VYDRGSSFLGEISADARQHGCTPLRRSGRRADPLCYRRPGAARSAVAWLAANWWEWRHIIPALAQKYTVIAPDLRGLGDSSRPLEGYDKRTVANDIWRLVGEKLGHKSFFLVGHDWGGPTAYALAAAHPEAVRRLVILDVVIPGSGGDFSEGGRRWHHQFHMTPDLPEALTQGREDVYLAWFYRTFAYRPDAIGADDLAEYLRTYRQPGAMRAGFAFYRALPQDVADNTATIARLKLPMPVLAMGGAVSYPHGRGRGSEPEQSLRRVAVDVRGETVPDCGHFIPEEAPELLNAHLLAFFAEV